MAQVFRLANQKDPQLDADKKIAFMLQRQLHGYKNLDKGEKLQVATTGSVLREIVKLSISPLDKAMCNLFIGTFFFAMRSCQCVQVQGYHKTKLPAIKNNRFFKNNIIIHHSSETLHLADCISITYESQKRDTKNDTIN